MLLTLVAIQAYQALAFLMAATGSGHDQIAVVDIISRMVPYGNEPVGWVGCGFQSY
jgi:hypothetical protein